MFCKRAIINAANVALLTMTCENTLAAERLYCLRMRAKEGSSFEHCPVNGFIGSHATLTRFGKLCVGPNGVARSTYNSLVESGRKKVFTRRSKNVFAQHLHFGASFCSLPLIFVCTWAPGHLSFRALLVANYKTLWRRIPVLSVLQLVAIMRFLRLDCNVKSRTS